MAKSSQNECLKHNKSSLIISERKASEEVKPWNTSFWISTGIYSVNNTNIHALTTLTRTRGDTLSYFASPIDKSKLSTDFSWHWMRKGPVTLIKNGTGAGWNDYKLIGFSTTLQDIPQTMVCCKNFKKSGRKRLPWKTWEHMCQRTICHTAVIPMSHLFFGIMPHPRACHVTFTLTGSTKIFT